MRHKEIEHTPERWHAALAEPSPPCTVVQVGALVPADEVDAYVKVGGIRWQ